jgi:hypothetical protein
VIYSTPTRGFTAAVSVFRGTPPPKPLDCKIWLDTFGALVGDRWSHSTGGEPRFSRALFSFVSVDIIEMSPSSRSQFVHLSFITVRFVHRVYVVFQETKNPASFTVSRVRKNLVLRFTCSPPGYSNSMRRFVPHRIWIGQGTTHDPGYDVSLVRQNDVSLARLTSSARACLLC